MFKKLNRTIIRIVGEENLIALELSFGIFGIVSGIVTFFYYFIKISQFYALIFIPSIIVGLLLIYKGRKDVLNGKIETKVNPY